MLDFIFLGFGGVVGFVCGWWCFLQLGDLLFFFGEMVQCLDDLSVKDFAFFKDLLRSLLGDFDFLDPCFLILS